MTETIARTNAEIVERFLDLLSRDDVAAVLELFTQDATVIAPYAPSPLPSAINGEASISAMFHMIMSGYNRVAYLDRRIIIAADPDIVVARWRTDIDVAATGRNYAGEVVALFEFDDGHIRCYTEYFNPDALRAAGVI